MTRDELKKACLELTNTMPVVYIATAGSDGMPFIRAVENLRDRERFSGLVEIFEPILDEFVTYFSTNTSSVKVSHIKENSAVSIYYCDPAKHRGLMLGGRMEIVTDSELKHAFWLDGWEMYYPKGKDDPDYTILRFNPEFARGWWENRLYEFSL
ncbi:MAG: pyridoxamine 5'-phosphate oxidase family protein [Candidatus Zixiibacteriota bacterium]|nr:MAG: pyridoxamine 5'-phosphate oxidase family protein [candidate division Zixibacteria bacterium]